MYEERVGMIGVVGLDCECRGGKCKGGRVEVEYDHLTNTVPIITRHELKWRRVKRSD